jgi:hypothetical protein
MVDCTQRRTFLTFWYNIFFYIFLLKYSFDKNLSFLYTYLLFSIPLVIIGEYIVWFTKLWKKCKFSFIQAILISLFSHWIPFIVYLYFKHFKGTPPINMTSLCFVIVSVTFYLLTHNIRKIYDI